VPIGFQIPCFKALAESLGKCVAGCLKCRVAHPIDLSNGATE
jgi:hypothetical protein